MFLLFAALCFLFFVLRSSQSTKSVSAKSISLAEFDATPSFLPSSESLIALSASSFKLTWSICAAVELPNSLSIEISVLSWQNAGATDIVLFVEETSEIDNEDPRVRRVKLQERFVAANVLRACEREARGDMLVLM